MTFGCGYIPMAEIWVKNVVDSGIVKEKSKMSNNSGPIDSSGPRDATLDFLIQVLKAHEQNLDKMIGKLSDVTEQIDSRKAFDSRFEEVEAKLDNLEKEIKRLASYFAVPANK